jgi:UDP-2,4-diacetamido-2,4,6-trideoxy-beta-L-altropyranose hydrolase
MLRVIFRADASLDIGSGHIMRCLTLADQLRAVDGAECHFICREHVGNLNEVIRGKGYSVHALPVVQEASAHEEPDNFSTYACWLGGSWQEDAHQCAEILHSLKPDWLFVDHYELDLEWESLLQPYCRKIGIVDDLANRRHVCDLLVDQSLDRKADEYLGLVPDECILLTGARYALLRPEFSEWRQKSLERRSSPLINHILISLGGVDKDNLTSRILESLERSSLNSTCQVTVVMGEAAPHLDLVVARAEVSRLQTEVMSGVTNMAELMTNADLAIGAAGSSTWERCCLGLPSIMVVLADNQQFIARILSERQIAIVLEDVGNEFEVELTAHINTISSATLQSMSQKALAVTDGSGASFVANTIGNTLSH